MKKPAAKDPTAGPETVRMEYDLVPAFTLVLVLVAPVPVLLLLVGVALFEVDVLPVGLRFPLVVIDNFIVIPGVIVAVVRVVNAIFRVRGTS
jgi:hypothetical protein